MKTLLSILISFLMIISMSAQVGVNNSSPDQALDVNGKIKLTDDATLPTAGTLRYNAVDDDFEGHNGSQWNSLTAKSTATLPSNPIPIYGYCGTITPSGPSQSLTFAYWTNFTRFTTPPSGKLLIITSIYTVPQNLSQQSGDFQYNIGRSLTEDGPYSQFDVLKIFSNTTATSNISGDAAPIFVLRTGEYLTISSSSPSINLGVRIRGFLVDNLNY